MYSQELVKITEMAARIEGIFNGTLDQKQMRANLNHTLRSHTTPQQALSNYPIRAKFAPAYLSRYPYSPAC